MHVPCIEGIYDDSARDIFMWAEDSAHPGMISDAAIGEVIGQNDNGGVVRLWAAGHDRPE